jgi:hypothetical protein
MVAQNRLQQAAGRPAHDLCGLLAREPGNISKPHKRLNASVDPYRVDEPPQFGLSHPCAEGCERFLDPADRASFPKW